MRTCQIRDEELPLMVFFSNSSLFFSYKRLVYGTYADINLQIRRKQLFYTVLSVFVVTYNKLHFVYYLSKNLIVYWQ